SFETNGGLKHSPLLQQFNTLIDAVPSKEGHTFLNWYDNAELSGEPVTRVPATDTLLYAKWALSDYIINFVPNGGDTVAALTYAFGDELSSLPVTTRQGYNFEGWYQDYYLQTAFSYANMPDRALTLYAKWSRKQYKVTFVIDGDLYTEHQMLYNDFITLRPERAGYSIAGYYTDEAKTVPYALGRMPSNDLTLYVGWRPITYSIQYVLSGGINAESNPNSYDFELLKTQNIVLGAPERMGFSFLYWYHFVNNCETQLTGLTQGDSGNKTIYAKWQINSYTLSFVTYSSPLSDITAAFEQPFDAEVARTGYNFAGWYFDEEYTQRLNTLKIPARSATLYAKWQLINYNITYVNGYTHGNMLNYSVEDESFDLDIAQRSGYTFVGWIRDGAPVTQLVIDKQNLSDITLTAWWQINSYTVNFNSLGGEELSSITAEYNSSITSSQRTTGKEHYIFDGWYDESYTQRYNLFTVPAIDITVYAKWTAVEYRIFYNLNGVTNNPLNVSTYTIEQAVTLYDITKYGYGFCGWYGGNDFSGGVLTGFAVGTSGNIHLYPKWQAVEATISFVSNGGSVVPPLTQLFATQVSPPGEPHYEGFSLDGWYTDEELTDRYSFGAMPAEDLVLYAKWTVDVYDIIYVIGSDVFDNQNPSSYTASDGEITLLPVIINGYTFIKWYRQGDGDKVEVSSIPDGNTGDVVLCAELVAIETEVMLDAGLGLIGLLPFIKINISFGNSGFILPVAILLGQVFIGWADADGVRYADALGNALRSWDKTTDVTLTAMWATQFTMNAGMITGFGGSAPESLVIPSSLNGVAVTGIADSAFSNKSIIKHIEVADGVSVIGRNAFNNCTSLLSIVLPDSVNTIGDGAFAGCQALTSINLPAKGTSIGNAVLRGCVSLAALKITTETTLNKLFGNTSFPGTYAVNIGGNFHYVPSSLTEVTIADGMYVAENTLYGATGIKTIILQNILEIRAGAFNNCSGAEDIYLPTNLQKIAAEAFANCEKAVYHYTSLNALTEIRERAFLNNKALEYLYADNLVTALDGAFAGCNSLKGLSFHGSLTLGRLFGTTSYAGSYQVIQDGAYYVPSSLSSIKLSSKVAVIAQNAFKDCIGVTEIINTQGLTSISTSAFKNSGLESFVVGNNVEQVGDGAFSGCQSLVSFVFDNGTLSTENGSIGQSILDGAALHSLTTNGKIIVAKLFGATGGNYTVAVGSQNYCLPDTLTSISLASAQTIISRSFYGIRTLEAIAIPSTVSSIGESAFEGCSALAGITIPEGVGNIGDRAFSGCNILSAISIPSTVSALGQDIFSGCSMLYQVYVDALNAYYETEDNVLYTKDGEALKYYPGTKTDNYYIIKGTVTEIYPSVFAENAYLTAIELPAGLEIIGKYAFYGRTDLSLLFGGFGNISYIGDFAFYDCAYADTQDFDMPLLTYVGESAFENCAFVGTVHCGDVEEVAQNAFKNSSITSFTAQSVAEIAFGAFGSCQWLETFVAETLDYVALLAFEGSTSVSEFTLPSNKAISYYFGDMPQLVKLGFSNTIGVLTAALGECNTLTGITLPMSVTNILATSFHGFSNLSEFTVDAENVNLAVSGGAVIRNGNTLVYYLPFATEQEYSVASGIAAVSDYAFANNGVLRKITLPMSLTSVGEALFYNTAITEALLYCAPLDDLLSYCSSLEKLTYSGGKVVGRLFANVSGGYSAAQGGSSFSIPASLTEISFWQTPVPNVLENCKNVTKAVLSGDTSAISVAAFKGCTALSEINLDNVTIFNERAFQNCQSLAAFNLPEVIDYVGAEAFSKTAWYENHADGGMVYLRNIAYAFKGAMPDNFSLKLLSGTTSAVKDIFVGKNKLQSIEFPLSVNELDNFVLKDCVGLYEVIFDEQSTIRAIPPYMFANCNALSTLSLPSTVVTIGDYAFQDCLALDGLSRPSGLLRIGNGAFERSALTSYTLSENLESVGADIFNGCDMLETLSIFITQPALLNGVKNLRTLTYDGGIEVMKLFGNLPDEELLSPVYYNGQNFYVPRSLKTINVVGAEVIKAYTFYGLSLVNEINLDEELTQIGDYAFKNSGLTEIVLPSSLTAIGISAFEGCYDFEIITMKSFVPGALSAPGLKQLFFNGTGVVAQLFSKTYYDNTYTVSYKNQTYYIPNLLYSITLYNTEVAANVLHGLHGIENVTLYEGITTIGERAFSGYRGILFFNNFSQLTSIGKDAFEDCIWYENFVLGQSGVIMIGRVAYEFAGDMPENYTLDIPAGTITLTDEAFAGSGNLVRVNLPSSLRVIGDGAFKNCGALEEVSLPAMALLSDIKQYAFSNCASLSAIAFAESLNEIGAFAFENCTALDSLSLPQSLEVLGESAFTGCGFFDLLIPSGLKTIGDAPFKNALIASARLMKEYHAILAESYVTEIIFPGADTAHKLFGNTAFAGSYGVSNVDGSAIIYYIPSSFVEAELTQSQIVAAYAFYNIKIETVTLRDD
ncbi:MAG: leucine-rich repeat protein, partial [Clostridia bacterium]|nr:leucine-rich repeat protein [Clostridia bacterium]